MMPVSYTHLDVYKRQLLSSMEGAINIVNKTHVKTDNGGLLIDCWAFTQKIRRSIILNLVGHRKLC